MAYLRCIISGISPYPGEVWSVGSAWTVAGTTFTTADLTEIATNYGVAIAAMTGNQLITQLSSAGKINKIRVEQRNITNESLVAAGEYTLPVPKAGTSNLLLPLQTSMVVSLLTATPGRSYRGRMYWPCWQNAPTPTGEFATATITAALAGQAQLMNAFKTACTSADPSFVAILVVRSVLLHLSTTVTRYGLGSVPDTQRKRRDNATEIYTEAPV